MEATYPKISNLQLQHPLPAYQRGESESGSEVRLAPPVFSEFAGATLAIAPPGAENDMPPNFCMAIKNQGGGAVAIAGDRPSVERAHKRSGEKRYQQQCFRKPSR